MDAESGAFVPKRAPAAAADTLPRLVDNRALLDELTLAGADRQT